MGELRLRPEKRDSLNDPRDMKAVVAADVYAIRRLLSELATSDGTPVVEVLRRGERTARNVIVNLRQLADDPEYSVDLHGPSLMEAADRLESLADAVREILGEEER